MARPQIIEVQGLANVTSQYRWNFWMTKMPVNLDATLYDINLRAESVTVPKMQSTSVEINIRGHKIKQPGLWTYDNMITLTLVEGVDTCANRMIKSWRDMCWQPGTGVQVRKADLAAVIRMEMLDNLDQAIWYYELQGCFLETYEVGGQFDPQNADPFKPSLQISYDWFNDGPTVGSLGGVASSLSATTG